MSASQARTYASVAFETALKDWLNSLGHLVANLSHNQDMRRLMADPARSFESKQDVLLALVPSETPQPVRNFLLAMLANGDISLVDEVMAELNHMTTAAGGPRPTVAQVTSAVELQENERLAIQNRLVDQFGPNLDFRFVVDPTILGGLVVRVGDKLLDTSVSSRLSALRQSLGMTSG